MMASSGTIRVLYDLTQRLAASTKWLIMHTNSFMAASFREFSRERSQAVVVGVGVRVYLEFDQVRVYDV